MSWKGDAGFQAGDFIEFTTKNGSVLRGTALSDLNSTGYASFTMDVPGIGFDLGLNANDGTIEVLFRASYARSFAYHVPKA
jgi:hypothetical protein